MHLAERIIATAALTAVVSLTGACGGEDLYGYRTGTSTPAETGQFGTPSKIDAYLEGKSLIMEGNSIPSHPNGYDEHTNFGQATQCYKKVTMNPQAGRYTVTSELGTLGGAPNVGDRGTCDRATFSAELEFASTAALVANVRGDGECFDFTITYPGFGQEGRGSLTNAGKTLTLELYFKDQATGHRCADGDVGDATVTLSQNPFGGDARQVYSVE